MSATDADINENWMRLLRAARLTARTQSEDDVRARLEELIDDARRNGLDALRKILAPDFDGRPTK